VLLAERSTKPVFAELQVPKMLLHASARRLRSCVRYLAENPQASDQDVAEGIGVSHSGQVSILLTRLHDGGLLVKDCGGVGRLNAWCFSAYGTELAHALYRH
jgi:hypothetical protein